jgi:2-iminobutanoate/2-iminopropanoate deaminase
MANVRTTIMFPDSGRALPIPDGARVGSVVHSSAFAGRENGKVPEDPVAQAAALFRNVARFMEVAGGTTDHIVKLTLYMAEEKYRSVLNQAWVETFPDPMNRPARHAFIIPMRAEGVLFQAEIEAVIEDR